WMQKKSNNNDLNKSKVRLLLPIIASYIHENYSTGLISYDDLHKKLIEIGGLTEANIFISFVRDNVGILYERGNNLFGFLHLSYQEYFAGEDLINQIKKGNIEVVKNKLGDPRWKEPIVLAISKVSFIYKENPELFDRLISCLLEVDEEIYGEIYPRAA